MKKTSALEWTIYALIIVDVILLALFLILHIIDVRLVEPDDAAPTGTGQVVTDARAPEDAALAPGEAEQILGAADASGRSAQTTLAVGDQQIDAELVSGTFQQRGGPAFSLYVDKSNFRLTENEGRCYVAASGNSGAKLYIELSFLPNTDAASVAPSLLKNYSAVTVSAGEKTEAFGGLSAVFNTGSSVETDLESYVISVDGGCLTVVMCTPGSGGEQARILRACLDSLAVQP